MFDLNKDVNVDRLIEKFTEMASRGALLTGEHIAQEDLLVQIVGVIVTEAMRE
jgi:hypothetical protein